MRSIPTAYICWQRTMQADYVPDMVGRVTPDIWTKFIFVGMDDCRIYDWPSIKR